MDFTDYDAVRSKMLDEFEREAKDQLEWDALPFYQKSWRVLKTFFEQVFGLY